MNIKSTKEDWKEVCCYVSKYQPEIKSDDERKSLEDGKLTSTSQTKLEEERKELFRREEKIVPDKSEKCQVQPSGKR